jgi:hypothetical protein
MSHHLALLPSAGIVQAEWSIASAINESKPYKEAFNLLLVPFPYVVHATDFFRSRPLEYAESGKGSSRYFSLAQKWLEPNEVKLTKGRLANFISSLIGRAEADVGAVHGIVFPEASLDGQLAEDTAKLLGKRHNNLEMIVAGTTSSRSEGVKNEAKQMFFNKGSLAGTFVQSKHHRWRLTASQIRQYQLGGVLEPEHVWWEDIDLGERKIQFGINRHDAVIAALVCEDLARYDPVLPVMTAVGPTLVIALLMDGPQLLARWSARYATALAEDPGSSVLTLTNLGMIKRSYRPGAEMRTVIGLWKDRETVATELILPDGHHGIVLSLNAQNAEQKTMDGRTDDGQAVEYRLGAIRSVQPEKPPKWLER